MRPTGPSVDLWKPKLPPALTLLECAPPTTQHACRFGPSRRRLACRIVGLTGLMTIFWGALQVHGQPTIISTIPADGATGVSPRSTVVFTFSESMDTTPFFGTVAYFSTNDPLFGPQISTVQEWSAGNKVLTCTPNSFPANATINWLVVGSGPLGVALGGTSSGAFTTSGTYNTNPITMVNIGESYLYLQASNTAPVLVTNDCYRFLASLTLGSNATATGVRLSTPSGISTNLSQNPASPEEFYYSRGTADLHAYTSSYPSGTYSFTTAGPSFPQPLLVTVPAMQAQPTAPHVSNFAAAQTVDPSQPFTLHWDAFPGGTTADYIQVGVGPSAAPVFQTPNPAGAPGALNGTATSVTIRAGILASNTVYPAIIAFYRYRETTNDTYGAFEYRIGATSFILQTGTVSTSAPPAFAAVRITQGRFALTLSSSSAQTLVVESAPDPISGQWQRVLSTNSPGGNLEVVDPQPPNLPSRVYRIRVGP